MKIRTGHAGPIQIAADITGESPGDFMGMWTKPLYARLLIYLFIYYQFCPLDTSWIIYTFLIKLNNTNC